MRLTDLPDSEGDIEKAQQYMLVLGRALKFTGDISDEEREALEQVTFDAEIMIRNALKKPAGLADA